MKNKVKIEIKVQENQPFWGGYQHQSFLVQIRTKLKKNKQNETEGEDNWESLELFPHSYATSISKFIEPSKGKQNLGKLQRRDWRKDQLINSSIKMKYGLTQSFLNLVFRPKLEYFYISLQG